MRKIVFFMVMAVILISCGHANYDFKTCTINNRSCVYIPCRSANIDFNTCTVNDNSSILISCKRANIDWGKTFPNVNKITSISNKNGKSIVFTNKDGKIENLNLLEEEKNNSDLGKTFTQVNKSMSIFNEKGKAVIFSAEGEGQIENFYFAGDMNNWHNPGQCTLNVYCDGELCLSGKLYELACMNMDYVEESVYDTVYVETPLYSKFGKNNSINLNFKIPYYKYCTVELVQPKPGVKDHIWTTVRANSKVNISYGGRTLPKGALFKGVRRFNDKIASGEQYTLMETSKNSMLVGLNLFLDSQTECSMEACLRAFNTADNTVQYLSSGLEDFFLGTYYFDSGQFRGYQTGQTYLNRKNGKVQLSAYRMFTDNPICFNHPVKVTVRNGDNNEINQDSQLTKEVAFNKGEATFGAFCFYYEW